MGWGPDVEIRLPESQLGGDDAAAVLSIGASGAASVATLGSPKVVLLNGVPVAGPSPLLHGDRLEVGEFELRFGDEAQLGETLALEHDDDVAIAIPSSAARTSRAGGRLLSLVDGREYEVGAVGLTIGRDPACDIVLSAQSVSRQHATIRQLGGGYVLNDSSRNGVFVNGARVHTELPLGRGDMVRVGAEEFRFYADLHGAEGVVEEDVPSLQRTGTFATPPRAVAVPVPAPEPSRPSFGYLEVINEGPNKGKRFELDSPRMTVGRGTHNDLAIADESVSEYHAKLQRREDSWWVIDLGSTNGTYVGGHRVVEERKVPLESDLRFGGVKMILRGSSEVTRSTGETRVIVGVKGPDPKRAEQRYKEASDATSAQPAEDSSSVSPILWLIVIVLVILAVYAYVRGGGQ